jgi:hypothetical protein
VEQEERLQSENTSSLGIWERIIKLEGSLHLLDVVRVMTYIISSVRNASNANER